MEDGAGVLDLVDGDVVLAGDEALVERDHELELEIVEEVTPSGPVVTLARGRGLGSHTSELTFPQPVGMMRQEHAEKLTDGSGGGRTAAGRLLHSCGARRDPERAHRQMTIDVAVPDGSVGPRRAADLLCRGLVEAGVDARLVARPHGSRANVHLSNSSRELLVPLARNRGWLVTLHDVVPRDRRLRTILLPVLRRVLARHRVVVHSRHAADLLHGYGIDQPTGVVPLALPVTPLPDGARPAAREELLSGSPGPLLVLAGVLKEAKGVAEVVAAAHDLPDARVLLVGRVADEPAAAALATRPANVTVVEEADDAEFCRILAAADAVLLPRSDSVGETSGPLVMAHVLGTPVAMLDTGSAPEYRLPEDLVAPAGTPVADLVDRAAAQPWRRTTATPDEAVARVVAAYCGELAELGWLAGADTDPIRTPTPDDTASLTDDHPS